MELKAKRICNTHKIIYQGCLVFLGWKLYICMCVTLSFQQKKNLSKRSTKRLCVQTIFHGIISRGKITYNKNGKFSAFHGASPITNEK